MNAGQVVENRWFRIYMRKSSSGTARLGLIISKRVIAAATARNFVKRLIREIFRREIPAKTAVDVVVRAKRLLTPETSTEGRQALIQLLQSRLS
jgi:ribonuclease P protein component